MSIVPFQFAGAIPASKSMMNRALVVKSFFPKVQILGNSTCDDVLHMQKATQLPLQRNINCGDAGTVLRFMALRLSREKGVFQLKGSDRLFERPQDELLFLLSQLGVQIKKSDSQLEMQTSGWKKPLVPLQIHREKSSQFATGLLLSAWNLTFDLEFALTPVGLKDPYWNMSLNFVESLGMQVDRLGKDRFKIPAGQKIAASKIVLEPDYSSAFPIAVTAALCGQAAIENVSVQSIQPDFAFIDSLRLMGVPIQLKDSKILVQKANRIFPIEISMTETPDLFPVMAVLCAHSDSDCRLTGAPRLIHKESNRIKKTQELLKLAGIKTEVSDQGFVIHGKGLNQKPSHFSFDPDQDHRMAMAAGVLMKLGWKIDLKTPQVVKKSFPEFWKMMGIKI